MSERRIELDTACPMCKKHKTIAVIDIDTTVYRGVDVEYPRVTFFCSTLGEDDDDAYFMPGTLWDINTSMMKACYYRTGAGMKEAMKHRIQDTCDMWRFDEKPFSEVIRWYGEGKEMPI